MSTWLVDAPRSMVLEGDVSRLDVWLAAGKVHVIGADGPARIEITKVGRKGVTVSLDKGLLSVRNQIEQKWWLRGPLWWFGSGWRHHRAEVTIAVPSTADGRLTLVSGSVVASGLRRGVAIDVTSGSVTLMGVGGTVRAKTISGSIQALGIAGDVGLETVSGEISVGESSADRVYARTISGSLTCDLDNPFAREVRLDTTSGEVTVRVPIDADLQVNLSALSGRVTSAFREVRPTGVPGLNSASGRIGEGTGQLSAYAISGSVSLLARPAEDYSEPAP
jgi:hypothetical protein